MEANIRNRTIAFAALFQCVEGVIQIAHRGTVDSLLFETSLRSIVGKENNEITDVYGGLDRLQTGFQSMLYQLGGRNLTPDGKEKDLEATRYAINILYLEKKLSAKSDVFQQLLKGIEEAQQQAEFFNDITHENVVAKLASIYTHNISKVGPRIMVKGEQTHLSEPKNAEKIRTLLLAGIRAALLWRQAGGDRWKLLFTRGKMQKQAELLLKEARAL
ncbi:MAG: high frequency lysogenization protein HflD [bacterium]